MATANNYIKVFAKVTQVEGEDAAVCGAVYGKRVRKLATIEPERLYRHEGSFSWVIPFEGEFVPELVELDALAIKADAEVAVGKGCAKISVWRATNGGKHSQIGMFETA